MPADLLLIHVPIPGDHYSGAAGGAIMTKVYEFSRQHEAAGGTTRIVVGRGTRHDYPVGECVEVDFRGLPSRPEKLADACLGLLGFGRQFSAAAWEPALTAIDGSFEGPVLVYNGPAALPAFRKARPRARLALYACNVLFRTYTKREVRRVVEPADFVVCVSDFVADDLAARLGGHAHKLRVVHNGVDVERFRPTGGVDTEEPLVLFVGRVVPEKGADVLLRASRKLLGRGRRFRVRIVGSRGFSAADPLSAYERSLRKLARPIGDAVEFHPFVDRNGIRSHYDSASIFCVPSNWDDPCPLTLLEAMACGLPTVAARRGGIPEVGAEAVLYFQPPSADELAERLAHLLDDESARVEMGRRARDRACSLSWAHQYAKLRAAVLS